MKIRTYCGKNTSFLDGLSLGVKYETSAFGGNWKALNFEFWFWFIQITWSEK